MTTRSTLISLATLITIFAAHPALANDADKAACEGLTEGADCVDGDGRAGACVQDLDDAVLSCEELDQVVCIGKTEGTACVEADGDPGACVDNGEGELECEDDGVTSGAGASGGGGSGAGGSGGDDDPDTEEERAADKTACLDLDEGDECTEADGDPGACKPDDSDPNVLECDDDALSSSSSSAGCNATGSPASAAGGLFALGLALAMGARRRTTRAR